MLVEFDHCVLYIYVVSNCFLFYFRMEPSSNQVKQAVNTAAIEKWRTKLPLSVQKKMYEQCDMLKELGYPK